MKVINSREETFIRLFSIGNTWSCKQRYHRWLTELWQERRTFSRKKVSGYKTKISLASGSNRVTKVI